MYLCICVFVLRLYLCVYLSIIDREICFKELAHVIIEAGKRKTFNVGQQAADPGKSWRCSLSQKSGYRQIPPPPAGQSSLLGPSADGLGPGTLWRTIYFTQSLVISMLISLKKYLHSHI